MYAMPQDTRNKYWKHVEVRNESLIYFRNTVKLYKVINRKVNRHKSNVDIPFYYFERVLRSYGYDCDKFSKNLQFYENQ